jgi:UDP-N-acetylmuramate-alanine ligase
MADDTTLFLKYKPEIRIVMNIIEDFDNLSYYKSTLRIQEKTFSYLTWIYLALTLWIIN